MSQPFLHILIIVFNLLGFLYNPVCFVLCIENHFSEQCSLGLTSLPRSAGGVGVRVDSWSGGGLLLEMRLLNSSCPASPLALQVALRAAACF